MVNSLLKVDFLHPTGHYAWEKSSPPPLEKILGAPLVHNIAAFCWDEYVQVSGLCSTQIVRADSTLTLVTVQVTQL